jgi:hypothetical protein
MFAYRDEVVGVFVRFHCATSDTGKDQAFFCK